MKNELFNELLASVQEMDDIVQGKKALPESRSSRNRKSG